MSLKFAVLALSVSLAPSLFAANPTPFEKMEQAMDRFEQKFEDGAAMTEGDLRKADGKWPSMGCTFMARFNRPNGEVHMVRLGTLLHIAYDSKYGRLWVTSPMSIESHENRCVMVSNFKGSLEDCPAYNKNPPPEKNASRESYSKYMAGIITALYKRDTMTSHISPNSYSTLSWLMGLEEGEFVASEMRKVDGGKAYGVRVGTNTQPKLDLGQIFGYCRY